MKKRKRKYVSTVPAHIAAKAGSPLVTRAKAALILGISVSVLKQWDEQGLVPSEVDPETGWHWYETEKLEKLLSKRMGGTDVVQDGAHTVRAFGQAVRKQGPVPIEGDVAARVFKELSAGKTPVQIVIDTEFSPDTVIAIIERWDRLHGSLHLTKDMLTRISALPLRQGETLTDSANAFYAVLERSLTPPACAKCKAKPARICTLCHEPPRENGHAAAVKGATS